MTDIKLTKLPHSEVEMTGQVPADIFENYRAKAISALSADFELPGFRKGKVPENIFLEKVPEMVILEEMAEMAINDTYPKIIEEQKRAARSRGEVGLDPIGRPEVSITKLAKGNPMEFKIKTALVPEVKLPDYKKISAKIAGEKEEVIATDEEVEKTIEEIVKARTPKVELKPSGNSSETTEESKFQGEAESSTETPITKHETETNPGVSGAVAELTDDFVKTLGQFENVAEFKTKLKENIKLEKEQTAKEKMRVKLLDALVEKSEIDLPKIIIEEEKNKLVHQLRYDVERVGLKFEDYLKNVKKTEEDIKKEWEGEAIKRAKVQFIISEIGIKENISPTDDEVSAEVKHLLEHSKDQKIDETRARIYLSSLITNQKVLEFLETQKTT